MVRSIATTSVRRGSQRRSFQGSSQQKPSQRFPWKYTGWFVCGGTLTLASSSFLSSTSGETPEHSFDDNSRNEFDVVVIGGGIVGLAVARQLAVGGERVCVVEKNKHLASETSAGNSGLGCTGFDSPLGSLEHHLLRRSIALHQNLYRSFGLSYEHVRKCGSLVLAWSPEETSKLQSIVDENELIGDSEAKLLRSPEEIHSYEPTFSPTESRLKGAVWIPREVVVEPWLVAMGYAQSASLHGTEFRLEREVVGAQYHDNEWTLQTIQPNQQTDLREEIKGKVIINCTGVFGDDVESMMNVHHSPSYRIHPRKGQFLVFQPVDEDSASMLPDTILNPVPTQITKGVIVWKTIYNQLIVGPTATNQWSKTDRSTDEETLQSLRNVALHMFPNLNIVNNINNKTNYQNHKLNVMEIGTHACLRPATQHRDYCIVAFPERQWISVSGIRSTGLTAASGLGEYVGKLYASKMQAAFPDRAINPQLISGPVPIDGLEESVSATHIEPPYSPAPLQPPPQVTVQAMPTLAELASEYQRRDDGCVTIPGLSNTPVFVTHFISRYGLKYYNTLKNNFNR